MPGAPWHWTQFSRNRCAPAWTASGVSRPAGTCTRAAAAGTGWGISVCGAGATLEPTWTSGEASDAVQVQEKQASENDRDDSDAEALEQTNQHLEILSFTLWRRVACGLASGISSTGMAGRESAGWGCDRPLRGYAHHESTACPPSLPIQQVGINAGCVLVWLAHTLV